MKRGVFFILCLLPFCLLAEEYKIELNVKGFKDSVCYLSKYYGAKQYYADTSKKVVNGKIIFTGEKPLEDGVYGVISDNSLMFEIIIDSDEESIIKIDTDTADYISNAKVLKSEANKKFIAYQRQSMGTYLELNKLSEESDKASSEAKKSSIAKQAEEIRKSLVNYKKKVLEQEKKTSMMFFLLNILQEKEVPEFKEEKNDSIRNVKKYLFTKAHYFDNIDFSDKRLVRTPIFEKKIDFYFSKLIAQHPDTIIKEIDFVMKEAKKSKDVYRFLVHKLAERYEESKIMGMDAPKVHMYINYFTKELTPWIDSKKLEEIRSYGIKQFPLLMGKKAPNLILADTSETKWYNLHKLETDFTLLIFWSATCSHCKEEIPKIKQIVDSINSDRLKVFAVSTYPEPEWKEFIIKNKINFINVAIPKRVYKDNDYVRELVYSKKTNLASLNFKKELYDINSTPEVYLLDKNKIIIGKKLDPINLRKMLSFELGNKEK